MCIRIDSNDINLLIYHYLQERGLHHTAFGFYSEAQISNQPLKPGALISYLHKSLQLEELQHHLNDKGIPECTNSFSLLKGHECRYIESPQPLAKEDILELSGHTDVINSLIYTSYIYSWYNLNSSNDGNIMIWSEDGCKHILPHLTATSQAAPVVFFSISSSKKIASFGGDDMVRIWDSEELSSTWQMQGITDLAWSPDGSKLMAVSHAGLQFLQESGWETHCELSDIMSAQWKNDCEFSVVTGKAVWLCKFGDSKMILEDSCSNARWNKQSSVLGMICSNRLGLFTESDEIWWISVRVTQFDFAPCGGIIVTGGFAGEIQFWDIERRVIRNSFQGHYGKILRIAFRDDGEFVATTATDGVLHIWKTEEFNKVKSFAIEPVGDLCFIVNNSMGCCSSTPQELLDNPEAAIENLINQHLSNSNIEVLSKFDKANPDKIILQYDNIKTNALGLSILISNYPLLHYLHKTLSSSFSVLEEQLELQNLELIELIIQNFSPKIARYYLPIYLQHQTKKEVVDLDHSLNFASICIPVPKKKVQPMHFAVSHGKLDFLQFIVSTYGRSSPPECFNLEAVDEETGENCALLACRIGNLQTVEFLHKLKCDFRKVNKNGENAVNLALVPSDAGKAQISVLPYLVEVVGLDIAENYEETLMLCRCPELVEYVEEKLRNRGLYVTKCAVEDKYQQSFSLANICQESPTKISSVPSLISSISYQDLSVTFN